MGKSRTRDTVKDDFKPGKSHQGVIRTILCMYCRAHWHRVCSRAQFVTDELRIFYSSNEWAASSSQCNEWLLAVLRLYRTTSCRRVYSRFASTSAGQDEKTHQRPCEILALEIVSLSILRSLSHRWRGHITYFTNSVWYHLDTSTICYLWRYHVASTCLHAYVHIPMHFLRRSWKSSNAG
jgi:hypothetical protein